MSPPGERPTTMPRAHSAQGTAVPGSVAAAAAANRALQEQSAASARPAAPAAPGVSGSAMAGGSRPPRAAAASPASGVDALSDEITSLKGTVNALIAQLAAAAPSSVQPAAQALRGHLGGLDDALMRCQKERAKMMAEAQRSAAPPAAAATDSCAHSLLQVGGVTGDDYLSSVAMYTPATSSWSAGPAMPSDRAYCAAACVGHHVFVVGGGASMEKWLNSGVRLDMQTGLWAEMAPMSTVRGSLACVELGGRVYALGGGQAGRYLLSTEVYHPGSNTWTEGPALQEARFSTAAAVLEGSVFCAGGFNGATYLRSMERFDPREGRWQAVAGMTHARGAHAMAAAHGRVFALGGFDGMSAQGGFRSVVESYEVRAGRWHEVEAMGQSWAYGAAAAVDGRLYAVGGAGEVPNERFEMFDVFDGAGRWVGVPTGGPPQPRSFLGAVVVPA